MTNVFITHNGTTEKLTHESLSTTMREFYLRKLEMLELKLQRARKPLRKMELRNERYLVNQQLASL